jgi:hypothetical protein
MATSSPHQGPADLRSMTALRNLKKRLSPRLLNVAGISGVGISDGALAVYLESDSDAVRQAVEQVMEHEAPDVPVTYVVTGKFRAHEARETKS